MITRLALFALGLLAFAVQPVRASQTYICSEVADHLTKTPDLTALAEKVYGAPLQYRSWTETSPCAVPTASLEYKTQTVLITAAEPPFQARPCRSTLSAHVFQRGGKDLKFTRTIKDFVKTGEYCIAGVMKPVTITGRDAFVIEGSGGGQGAKAGWLEFYQFQGAGIRQIKLPGLSCTWVDYRDGGPAVADLENIFSQWRIGGPNNSRLFLDFTVIKPKPKTEVLKTEWAFGRGGLKLVRGRTPEAFADGACL
jgi:hypothetical protein